MRKRAKRFRIFTRTWWKENPEWPDGLEPEAGPQKTIGYADTEREARGICSQWNATHKPGRLSLKAEFSEDFADHA